jgi:hypothetical protein
LEVAEQQVLVALAVQVALAELEVRLAQMEVLVLWEQVEPQATVEQ